MTIKHIYKYIRNNYLLSLFIAIVFFTLFTGFIKITASKPTYIYAKVKMGQGLWWASTAKPPIWFVHALKKGEKETGLLGKPTAEIIAVRSYPIKAENQYDIYLTLKLAVSADKKNGAFSFKRSPITIGSPVEFEFPSAQVSGTVIALNKNPFAENRKDKIVYLVFEKGYYKDFSYRYDSIRIGDVYYDGENTVFEVLDKQLVKNIESVDNVFTGRSYEIERETKQNIVVKAKIKIKEEKGQMIYGEEYKVTVNSSPLFSTNSVSFNDFFVRKIE